MPQFVAIALVAVATLGSYAGGVWKALRWVLFALVIYFFVLPLVPAFRGAIGDLRQIDPILLAAAIGLEFVALYCYTLVTHAALGPDAYNYTAARTTLDLSGDYQINKRCSLNTNIRNIFNAYLVNTRYGSVTPGYAQPRQYRHFGVYFSAGIKGTF